MAAYSDGECVMCQETKPVNDRDLCEECWPNSIFARNAEW